jgi:hypothetical protein
VKKIKKHLHLKDASGGKRPCENIRERVVSLAVLALFASSLALSQDLEVKAPRVP